MSLDPSLKTGGGIQRHRNVLTRAERVEKLAAGQRYDPQDKGALGLPKVGNRKLVTGKKTKKKAESE